MTGYKTLSQNDSSRTLTLTRTRNGSADASRRFLHVRDVSQTRTLSRTPTRLTDIWMVSFKYGCKTNMIQIIRKKANKPSLHIFVLFLNKVIVLFFFNANRYFKLKYVTNNPSR